MQEKIGLDFRFYIKDAHVYFYVHVFSAHLALSRLLILTLVCKCPCVFYCTKQERVHVTGFIWAIEWKCLYHFKPWHTSSPHCKTCYKMLQLQDELISNQLAYHDTMNISAFFLSVFAETEIDLCVPQNKTDVCVIIEQNA